MGMAVDTMMEEIKSQILIRWRFKLSLIEFSHIKKNDERCDLTSGFMNY